MSHPALLLLGPTGSGKTPLGELLERCGLWGRWCVHFDFGATLRAAVEADRSSSPLSSEELDFLRRVLQTGVLLEDEHFPIARRLLEDFLARRRADDRTLLVLNGLPRHAGQAEAVASIAKVQTVVELRCDAETILKRLRTDAGGDRAGRTDDDTASVRAKLATYAARTEPLLAHYRNHGVRIATIEVTPTMTPAEARKWLETRPIELPTRDAGENRGKPR